jgi:hypothetical protein
MASQEVVASAVKGTCAIVETGIVGAVDNFLKQYFEKHRAEIVAHPTLPIFQPSSKSLLSDLWLSSSKVPSTPKRDGQTQADEGWTGEEFPSLLLHDLDKANMNTPAHNTIQGTRQVGPLYLYGTSGAGKTRSIFENLSQNKGFYFVCDDFLRNPGSKDLHRAMKVFDIVLGKMLPDDDREKKFVSLKNYELYECLMWVLLYIRLSVHQTLEKHVDQVLTDYEWLLYQLYPNDFLGCDLFQDAMVEVQEFLSSKAISNPAESLKEARVAVWKVFQTAECRWSVFVDEAQALISRENLYFASSKNTQVLRSYFSAVAKAFCSVSLSFPQNKVYFPVFAGTGLSLVEIQEEASSVMAKAMNVKEYEKYFSGFALLGKGDVRSYLGGFLDLKRISDDVLSHVACWLRGRPRWTATFLEIYVMRGKITEKESRQKFGNQSDNTMMEALERYLDVMTRDRKAKNRRESWNPGRASAFASFDRMMTSSSTPQKAIDDLQRAVLKYAVGDKPAVFDKNASEWLIRFGLVAIASEKENEDFLRGSLDEPIIVEAGLNYSAIDERLRDNLQNQESGGQGHAFERVILPGLLRNREKVEEVALTMVEKEDVLKVLPQNYYSGTRSSYGVLALDAYDRNDPTSETLEWIDLSIKARFEGQVPPFCFPCESFGPDLLFLLRKEDFSDFRACLVQAKFRREMSQPEALRTLVPDWLFFNSRDKAERKLSLTEPHLQKWNSLKSLLVSGSRPCIRLMVQFPKEKTKTAMPGLLASDVAGTNSKDGEKKAKRDLLLTIDQGNMTLFGDKEYHLLSLLKSPARKKQRGS